MYAAWDTQDTDSYCLCCDVVCHSITGRNEITIKGKVVRLCDTCFCAMQSDTNSITHSRVVAKLIHYSVNANANAM